MCDCCPATSQILHLYTISFLTGERLCICVDCADHNAEPEWSLVHGVNRGALANLPKEIKNQLTVWTAQGYCSIYALDRHLKKRLPLPAPDCPIEEQDDAARIMESIKRVAQPFDTPAKRPGLFSTILRYILPGWDRSAQSAPSTKTFPA